MGKSESKKKAETKPAGDLSLLEIKEITDQLAKLRKKLRENGATALSPTEEWNTLRKEIALLNKNLNADAAAKQKAREAVLQAADSPPSTEL